MSASSTVPPVDRVETVVLLSADSLRLDRVHAERNGVPLTPVLDSFASDAVEFREGISPGPSTRDSMPSLMTGAFPSQFSNVGLPEAGSGPVTLPEALSEVGFSTAGFSHNNFISRKYNHDRGFDHYFDVSAESRTEGDRGGAWRLRVRDLIDDTPLMEVAYLANSFSMRTFGTSLFRRNEGGDSLTDHALQWLDETSGKRFLWLHYMDTHHPYHSPDRIQREFGRTFSERQVKRLTEKARTDPDAVTDSELADLEYIYDCSVRFVDDQIGRVIDHLERADEMENALIAVTADHGEAFGEHGEFGHTNDLWDELLRVPLLVRDPELEGAFVDGQAPLRLLFETIVDGSGWFDLLDDGKEYVTAEVPEFRDPMRCCRGHGYKLITHGDERIATRIADGTETTIDPEEIPEDTLTELESRIDVDRDPIDVSVDVADQELRDDLAALGYLE